VRKGQTTSARHRWILGLGGAAAAATVLSGTVAGAAYAAPAHVTAASYTPAARTLGPGSHGSDVTRLQQRLAQLAYYPGTIDGKFGGDTEEAVWAFQEVQGIRVTGTVASQTERALVNPRYARHLVRNGGANRIEISLGRGVLYVYRNNHIVLISHISPGGGYYYSCGSGSCLAHTPTGNYHTTTFMRGWVTVPLGQMYNPVFFISTVYAIHGDTYVPLQPVSHGCVRIPMDIAAFFHTLVSSHGEPVYVRASG
jgi:peptidoglycan hydrolase-like protein with peptidoglycan-binding domain